MSFNMCICVMTLLRFSKTQLCQQTGEAPKQFSACFSWKGSKATSLQSSTCIEWLSLLPEWLSLLTEPLTLPSLLNNWKTEDLKDNDWKWSNWLLLQQCTMDGTSTNISSTLADQVKNCINERFDALYTVDENGEYKPHVCVICDKFLSLDRLQTLRVKLLERNAHRLKSDAWNFVPPSLAKCYMYEGECGNNEWIHQLLLSPQATYVMNWDGRSTHGFSVLVMQGLIEKEHSSQVHYCQQLLFWNSAEVLAGPYWHWACLSHSSEEWWILLCFHWREMQEA